MVSPKVLYGIDYNVPGTHHVYGIFEQNSPLNILSYYQQLERIREPLSANVHVVQSFSHVLKYHNG